MPFFPPKIFNQHNNQPHKNMDNYQCEHCSTLIQSGSTPSNSGCPESSFHRWHKLGAVGDLNYQCKKCGTLVKSKSTPSNSGCSKASFHQWNKL